MHGKTALILLPCRFFLWQPLLLSATLICVLLLASCSAKNDDTSTVADTDYDLITLPLSDTILKKPGFPVIISDSNWQQNYSKDFFNGYKRSRYSTLHLRADFLVLDKKDTAVFPDIPSIGKTYELKATDKEITIRLTFARINFTSIRYALTFTHPFKKTLKAQGMAHLHPDFFLRIDRDNSTASGATFMVTEFLDLAAPACPVKIRLGYEEISGSAMQAKIERKCNGSFGSITTENFPSLIEQ